MSRVTREELYSRASHNSRTTVKSLETIENILEGLIRTILEDLERLGSISITNFGTFELVERGGYDKRKGNFDGTVQTIWVEKKNVILFTPSKAMTDYVNNPNPNKKYYLRTKKGVRRRQIIEREKVIRELKRGVDKDFRGQIKTKEGALTDMLNKNKKNKAIRDKELERKKMQREECNEA